MAGGLGEELELEEGGLIGLGTVGEGLEELEAEGVCFIEGEFFEDAWGIGERGRFDADEAGLQEAAEEGGVLREAGGEKWHDASLDNWDPSKLEKMEKEEEKKGRRRRR
jgi:hypothetical protein